MNTGKIKWFNPQKGYGFISYDGNKEIFIHFKDVKGGINAIKENDEVTFDTIEGKKGLQAINVKKV
jgi:CspA family cold shock protein